MPANATIVLVASQVAAASFFFAAATSVPDPVSLAHDAALAAQRVIQLSEEYVILVCFGGGILGATVAYGFNLFKGSGPQQAWRFLTSAVMAGWVAPYFMLWRSVPQTLIPSVFVSGAVGLVAHMLVPLLTEVFYPIIKHWMRRLGILPNETISPEAPTTKLKT